MTEPTKPRITVWLEPDGSVTIEPAGGIPLHMQAMMLTQAKDHADRLMLITCGTDSWLRPSSKPPSD